MTEQEMAEEYVNKNNIEWELECHRTSPIGEVIQAFLAGLKAGRLQWHEIESKISPKREISKKYMPKNEEKVLLKYHFYGEKEVHISDGYYDAYDFQFHIANNPKHIIVCVIAWCEIPKYTDKE